MKISVVLISTSLSILLTACPGFVDISKQPTKILASKTTIRVGEELRLAIEREAGPTNTSGRYYGFIYSSSSSAVPYLTNSQGVIIPDGRPELFPVSPIVDITEPTGAINNVSPLALARYDGRYVQTEVVIRGRQVGTATIKAGFVKILDDSSYGRIPDWNLYDGAIQITVVE